MLIIKLDVINILCVIFSRKYCLGMLETPRSCLEADKVAMERHIDFILISSNELTQLKCDAIFLKYEKVYLLCNI